MDRRSFARVFGLMLLIALGLSSSFAQGTTSRVTGRVVDASGAAIPGAAVTLTNETTNISLSTQTGNSGGGRSQGCAVQGQINRERDGQDRSS